MSREVRDCDSQPPLESLAKFIPGDHWLTTLLPCGPGSLLRIQTFCASKERWNLSPGNQDSREAESPTAVRSSQHVPGALSPQSAGAEALHGLLRVLATHFQVHLPVTMGHRPGRRSYPPGGSLAAWF